MAELPARLILLAMLGSCIGYSIARSVPTSDDLSDVGADVTHNSMTSDVVRCDEAGCAYDMHLYCLSNGIIVMGSCSLKKTLCTSGVRNELILASGWDACFRSSYNLPLPLALDRSMVMVYTDKSADTEEQSQSQDSEPDLKSTDTHDLLEAVDDNDNNDDDDDIVDDIDNAGQNSKEESSDDDDDDDDDNVDGRDNAGHNSKEESSVSTFNQQKQSQNNIVDKPKSIFADLSMADLELGELVGGSASNPMSETVSKSAKGKQKENVAMETEKMAMEEQLLDSLGEKDLAKVMDSA